MLTTRLPLSVLLFLLVLALAGCGQPSNLSTTTLPTRLPNAATHSTARPKVPATSQGNGLLPVRLIIPAIGVTASIERVGISANGDLAVPTVHPWDGTGWYSLGPRPGERGSAVIDGHLDRPGGYPAIFWNLHKLSNGDLVMVSDRQGKTFRYRVFQVASYAPQNAPLQTIFGNNGGNYLNLITCAGDWIPSQHQTTLRLVVYTVLM